MEGTDQQDSSSFVWGSMKKLTNYFAQSNAAKKELTAKPFCVSLLGFIGLNLFSSSQWKSYDLKM